MFTSVSGLTHAGDTATGFKVTPFSSALAGLTEMAEPTMRATGSILSSLPSTLENVGNQIVNIFNNQMGEENKMAEVYQQALSSVDMGSLKDMMNPILLRTTLSQF